MTYSKEDIVVGMTYHTSNPVDIWQVTAVRDDYYVKIARDLYVGDYNKEGINFALNCFNSGDWKIISSPNQTQNYAIF